MGEQPRNAPLPPHRKWWVERMSRGDRRSYLIAEELERMAATRAHAESAAIRKFLTEWRKATSGGNPAGFDLRIKQAKVNTAVVVAFSPCAGPVRWLPAIVVPWNHRFERIGRECGDAPLFPCDRSQNRDVWGRVEKQRPPVLSRFQVRLIRPSR